MTSSAIWGTIAALGMTGLLGSFGHCLGMCGPLVVLAGSRFPRRGLASAPYHLLYNLAKAAVYTVLGALAGGLGALAFHAAEGGAERAGMGGTAGHLFALVSLLGGALVIFSGMIYLGWLRLGAASRVGALWGRGARLVSGLSGPGRALALGALNGLLPCGLVYSGLLIAAASGSPLAGGLGMFVFGLGTMPSLLVVGAGAGLITQHARRLIARVAGGFVLLVGLQLVLRGVVGFGLIPVTPLVDVLLW